MTAGRLALRRRLRRRGLGAPGGGGGTGTHRLWLGAGALAGIVLAIIATVFGAGVIYAITQYDSIANGVVPPDQLLARYSRGGARVYDRNGKILYEFVDELAGLRRPVALNDLSPWVSKATVSVEDPDFRDNVGVNVRGLVRAGVENFTPFLGGGLLSGTGGSSITQQLAKNVYIPREERSQRSVERKLKETVIALELTKRYSKDQILEWYLNSISYGGIYVGIEAASEGYFGKPAKDLTLPEAALLAGIPQSPALYDPFNPRNIDSTGKLAAGSYAKTRQGEVLALMAKRGAISEAEAKAALDAPVQFKADRFDIEAPHFVLGRVADEIRKRFGARALTDQGLEITTTLDLDLQHTAEQMVNKNLTDFGDQAGDHNGAFLAMDPKTGQILVWVGSRDFFDDELEGRNDNVTARNSPGSTLKPFTYMTAFMHGWGTGTAVLDTPLSISDPSTGGTFSPRNPGTVGYLGPIPAEKALGNSLNVSAIKAIMFAGVQNTIATLKKVGYTTFDSPGGYGPALTTGGSEITLLDHLFAYSVLANNGVMRGQDLVVTPHTDPQTRTLEPIVLLKVTDADHKVLYQYKQPQEKRVIPAEYAYMVTSVLSNGQNFCITYGVCNALALPNGYPSAAKTGTSEPFEDSTLIGETWTMGYTPELVAGIWSGNADNAPIKGIDSTTVAFRTWRDFMVEALKTLKLPATPFTRPPGLVDREVCWPSGLLPSADCPAINRYTSLYAAEQLSSDPKALARLTDTWWQKTPIDTRTGLIADKSAPPAFVKEEVRLVLPPEAAGWSGLADWAARNGIASMIAPGAEEPSGSSMLLITNPTPNDKLSGTVTIVGRAASADFQSYTVDWGRGTQPVSWVSISTSRAPAPGGVLGSWDTTKLANGTYMLRLRMDDAKRGTRQFAVPVTIDNGGKAPASDPAPVLVVSSPATNAVLQGSVPITGSATSGRLAQFRVEVGAGLNPSTWASVGSSSAPVTNGTLATWDTSGVDDGTYTLRVVLVDAAFGEASTQVVVMVSNKGRLPQPTPTPTAATQPRTAVPPTPSPGR